MIEAGKVYKVNKACLVKVLSIHTNGTLADTILWPINDDKRPYIDTLTCGPTSCNNYVEHKNGTWEG